MEKEVTYFDDEGDEVFVSLPHKFEVCPTCEGHGTHLNPSIGQHGYSSEEFDEAFEPGSEEREHYFKRGGIYDVTCEECKGSRVVAVVDEARLTPEQKANFAEYFKYCAELAQADADDRATMRGECG